MTKTQVNLAEQVQGVLPSANGGPIYLINDYAGANFEAQWNAAMTAMGTNPGTIKAIPGSYSFSTVKTFQQNQGFDFNDCVLSYTGTGTAIRIQDSRAFTGFSALYADTCGPGQAGVCNIGTLDGTSATSTPVGIHAGDISNLRLTGCIRNFSATGGIGLWLDNRVTWTEGGNINLNLMNCTTHVQYDVNSGDASFDYASYNYYIVANPNQDGVVFKNACDVRGVDLEIRGLFNTVASNTGTVLKIGADSTAVQLRQARVHCAVETGGTVTNGGHTSINLGSAALFDGFGFLNFIAGSGINFVAGTYSGTIVFEGNINVDSTIGSMAFNQARRCLGGSTTSGFGFLSAAGDIFIGGGNTFLQTMTTGAQTISCDSSALTAMNGQAATYDLFLQQPSSGSPSTFTWSLGTGTTLNWESGQPPTTRATNSAIDHIRLVTKDHVTFWGQHVNSGIENRAVQWSSTTTTLTLDHRLWMFNGTSATTWTLPSVATVGDILMIKNQGTAVLTVNRAGSDVIWTTGSATSLTLRAGDAYILESDGFDWNVIGQSEMPRARTTAITSEFNLNTSTTETTVVSLTLPQGDLMAGTTYRITLHGTVQTTSTSGTLTFKPYMGANVSTETYQMASQTSAAGPVAFMLQVDMTCRTSGSSGTYVSHGYGRIEFTTPVVLSTTTTTTATVDTTAASPVVKLTATWATSSASNKLLVETATIEQIA